MNAMAARWVLAFDASCGTCREVSRAVARACDGRLEVLPLSHDAVREWRAQAVGSSSQWAPTLLRVQDGRVRAWTGRAMGLALVRHLGPRGTMNVLRALGRLRHDDEETAPTRTLRRLAHIPAGRRKGRPQAWF